jgi:hypothetical protein
MIYIPHILLPPNEFSTPSPQEVFKPLNPLKSTQRRTSTVVCQCFSPTDIPVILEKRRMSRNVPHPPLVTTSIPTKTPGLIQCDENERHTATRSNEDNSNDHHRHGHRLPWVSETD